MFHQIVKFKIKFLLMNIFKMIILIILLFFILNYIVKVKLIKIV